MIKITKEEAQKIRDNLRGVKVTITGRQHKSNAKKYYVEESPYVLKYLDNVKKKQRMEHYE